MPHPAHLIRTGHRGRGSGIGLSLVELEVAIQLDRQPNTIFFVDSNVASGGNGRSWGGAFQTTQEAENYAPAGSTLCLAPLHVETITAAAGLVLNTAGLTILGFGNGDRRPQIDFTTVVGASMDVTAESVTFYNIRFTGGVDALTGPVNIQAADCTLIDCITEDVTGQATDFIEVTTAGDRLTLIRWEHRGSSSAGANTALTIDGCDQVIVEDAWIFGDFAVACIEQVTTAGTNIRVYGNVRRPCYLESLNSNDILVTLKSDTTGDIGPGIYARLADDAANITQAFAGAAARFFNVPGTGGIMLANAGGERAIETNITPSAG